MGPIATDAARNVICLSVC